MKCLNLKAIKRYEDVVFYARIRNSNGKGYCRSLQEIKRTLISSHYGHHSITVENKDGKKTLILSMHTGAEYNITYQFSIDRIEKGKTIFRVVYSGAYDKILEQRFWEGAQYYGVRSLNYPIFHSPAWEFKDPQAHPVAVIKAAMRRYVEEGLDLFTWANKVRKTIESTNLVGLDRDICLYPKVDTKYTKRLDHLYPGDYSHLSAKYILIFKILFYEELGKWAYQKVLKDGLLVRPFLGFKGNLWVKLDNPIRQLGIYPNDLLHLKKEGDQWVLNTTSLIMDDPSGVESYPHITYGNVSDGLRFPGESEYVQYRVLANDTRFFEDLEEDIIQTGKLFYDGVNLFDLNKEAYEYLLVTVRLNKYEN